MTMTPEKLQKLGLNQVVYIRPEQNGSYGVHAADGTLLHVLDGIGPAIALAQQNDLMPVTLH